MLSALLSLLRAALGQRSPLPVSEVPMVRFAQRMECGGNCRRRRGSAHCGVCRRNRVKPPPLAFDYPY